MCANTLCPLSNSTRNCVFGSASVTAPSTSITSSLAKNLSFLARYKMTGAKRISYHAGPASHTASAPLLPAGAPVPREDPGAVLRHGDRVLEVGREGAVRGVDGPLVPLVEVYRVVAERDHGLYRERHPRQQLDPGPPLAGVRGRRGPGRTPPPPPAPPPRPQLAPGPPLAVVRDLRVLVHLPPYPVRDEVTDHPVAL